ncbi:MAG: AmmeMemoRadiSam system protein B [Balneolaceae bacterium]
MLPKLFDSYTHPIPPFRYDVEIIPVNQNGDSFIYFHDQLGYTAADFAVPYSAQTIFSLLDGNRSVQDIMNFSTNGITKEQMLKYVQFLDENALLNSEYFKAHSELVESKYEESEVHNSNTAGISYPDDPEELRDFLDEAFSKLETSSAVSQAKALYAPHIDPRVGLNSYVKAFSAIKNLKPKRVVILATSHYSGVYPDMYEDFPFVISDKNFNMVNGKTEADHNGIQKILKQVQSDQADYGISFQDRAHRIEHSIEMHLLFLNHLWNHDFKVIPILIGGLDELFYKEDGFQGKQVSKFTKLLKDLYEDEETFFLISGDLAHVGKKFGDPQPAKQLFDEVRDFDELFLGAGADGNHQKMLDLMSQKYDPYRICGFPPLYTFLKTFPKLKGEILSYDIWDEEERESGVSFGSILYW